MAWSKITESPLRWGRSVLRWVNLTGIRSWQPLMPTQPSTSSPFTVACTFTCLSCYPATWIILRNQRFTGCSKKLLTHDAAAARQTCCTCVLYYVYSRRHFYRAKLRYGPVSVSVSVRVCLSQVGILLPKRLNTGSNKQGSNKQHHWIAQMTKDDCDDDDDDDDYFSNILAAVT